MQTYRYYLHFKLARTIDDVIHAFQNLDPDVDIVSVYDNSYEIFSSLSNSKVRQLLRTCFPDDDLFFAQTKQAMHRDASALTDI